MGNKLDLSADRQDFAAIILAAGKGVRMKSSLPKVLHKIVGQPMILRTINILDEVGPCQIIVITSRQSNHLIKKTIGRHRDFALQRQPLGTADAVRAGLNKVRSNIQTIAVMYADDSAFYKPQTILEVFKFHQKKKAKITFVTVLKEDPIGFGRVIRKNDRPIAIVEEKDATYTQKSIKEINDGLYFFDRDWLLQNLPKLKASPTTGELYITDLIAQAKKTRDLVQAYRLRDSSQWQAVDTQEELKKANAKFQKRIHIMGMAGSGASAVAGIAKGLDWEVTGCDLNPASSYSKNLEIYIQKGHNSKHLQGVSKLIVSPAVIKLNPQNQEILHAKKLNIPIITWQKFQGKFLQKDKFVITVAGAYGKSTTAAMIAKILKDLGLDPTAEIGATVLGWSVNFRVGHSKYYVCEADEYNDNFLNYQSDIAVILNMAWDHPDYFKTKKQLIGSYKKFINNIKKRGTLVIFDAPDTNDLIKSVRDDIKVVKVGDFGKYNLSMIGDFRRENANASLAVAEILGLDLKMAKKSLESFKGLGRRLEYKGEVNGIKVYDDYAVQPYTVKVTANALKKKFKNKKIALVFEPHTFSRVETFFDDFVSSLKNTKIDRVIITNIYAARERGDSRKLATKLAKSTGPKAKYIGSIEQTAKYLKSNLKDFDVILSMGAGNIYKLYDLLKE